MANSNRKERRYLSSVIMISGDRNRFIQAVYDHYKKEGRHDLPWRVNTDPYYVLVSEIMLQQTQVDRVVPKFNAFVTKYPSVHKLAQASIKDVLILWQGLGYNRRAKYLLEAAKTIQHDNNGMFINKKEYLLQLSGVGSYTAAAVRVFGFNIPDILIETNIRTVYISYFYKNKEQVSDRHLEYLLEHTLDMDNPREWYWALMDYGSYIKKNQKNYSRQSSVYKKQPAFKGSNREIRGVIIKTLLSGKKTKANLLSLPFSSKRILTVLRDLTKERLVHENKEVYYLP